MPQKVKAEWPLIAGWLDRSVTPALNVRIVERNFCDLGLGEMKDHPNRSPRIDKYLRWANVPEDIILSGRGYWCAAQLGAVWRDAGARVPTDYANCDAWVKFAKQHRVWSAEPVVGAAVLYGIPGDASHIGGIVRVPDARYDLLLNIEGNTSLNGYSNNGVLCDLKAVTTTRVLGYVHPFAA